MEKDKKTFVILIPGFPANEQDGTCLPFPQLFVKTLQKQHPALKVIVFAFQYPFSSVPYHWHGVTVYPFNGRERGKLSRLFVWWRVNRKFRKMARAHDVAGLLNFWLGECSLIGTYLARKYGLPAFTWLMGQDARQGNRYVNRVKPTAGELIALSDFLADELHRNYRIRPAHVIVPGVDAAEFSMRKQARTIDIIGVGSLITLKRYDVFIEIIAGVAKTFPQVKAVICGKGPERDRLIDQIWNAGLQANIDLLDETTHAEVLCLMQRSKILLHPSSYEGFPTVYAEALYAGAHVVGFFSPMNHPFAHQHVGVSKEDMLNVVVNILSRENTDHASVLTCSIEETCSRVLALYDSAGSFSK